MSKTKRGSKIVIIVNGVKTTYYESRGREKLLSAFMHLDMFDYDKLVFTQDKDGIFTIVAEYNDMEE